MSARGVIAAAAVVIVAATGCNPASGKTTVTTTEPSVRWVVDGSSWSHGVDGWTYSVNCVPAEEFGLDPTQQAHEREVQTERATSEDAVDGTPCPDGPIIREW